MEEEEEEEEEEEGDMSGRAFREPGGLRTGEERKER